MKLTNQRPFGPTHAPNVAPRFRLNYAGFVRNAPQRTFSTPLLFLLVLGATVPACLDNQCDQIDDSPTRYTGGHTNAARTVYESSTEGETYLRFPAARNFHLVHGLRDAPTAYDVWVSFNQDGAPESKAAGDQAWVYVTDDYIGIRNKTCADVFLRVVAWTEAPEADTSSVQESGGPTLEAGAEILDAAIPNVPVDAASDAAARLNAD